jgi:hypothetical protein
MTIKNADMPAMPAESISNTGQPYYTAIPSNGLTKREHIAAMAMQGLISAGHSHEGGCSLAVLWANELINNLEKAE